MLSENLNEVLKGMDKNNRKKIEEAYLLEQDENSEYEKIEELIDKVLKDVGFPEYTEENPIIFPENATPEQIQIATCLLYFKDKYGWDFAIPYDKKDLRQWLCLEKSILIESIEWVNDGKKIKTPRWFYYHYLKNNYKSDEWGFETSDLRRLKIYTELIDKPWKLRQSVDLNLFQELILKLGANAVTISHKLIENKIYEKKRSEFDDFMIRLCIVFPLVENGEKLEPPIDLLLPISKWFSKESNCKMIAAISEKRRKDAIMNSFNKFLSEESGVIIASQILFEFPIPEIAKYAVKHFKKVPSDKKTEIRKQFEAIALKHKELEPILSKLFENQKPKSEIKFENQRNPKSIADLNDIQKEQYKIILKDSGYEPPDMFKFMEIWDITVNGKTEFEIYCYMVDTGKVFRVGTTKVVADIIQFGLDFRRVNKNTKEIIETALENEQKNLPQDSMLKQISL